MKFAPMRYFALLFVICFIAVLGTPAGRGGVACEGDGCSGAADVGAGAALLQKETQHQVDIQAGSDNLEEAHVLLHPQSMSESSVEDDSAISNVLLPLDHGQHGVPAAPNASRDTLYMHFHMPKTGGTTVSNLMVASLCKGEMKNQGWEGHCSRSCENALVDTELSCLDGERREHPPFSIASSRAQRLVEKHGARSVLYVTTVRAGWQRVISQWSHELEDNTWSPTSGTPPASNASLLMYLRGEGHKARHHGFAQESSFPARNNHQVAQLASVPTYTSKGVWRDHLEAAKAVLLSDGNHWLIGFPDCMALLQERLSKLAGGSAALGMMPHQEARSPPDLVLNEEVVRELQKRTALDNELYEWALAQARRNQRFAGPCDGGMATLPTVGGIARRGGRWLAL